MHDQRQLRRRESPFIPLCSCYGLWPPWQFGKHRRSIEWSSIRGDPEKCFCSVVVKTKNGCQKTFRKSEKRCFGIYGNSRNISMRSWWLPDEKKRRQFETYSSSLMVLVALRNLPRIEYSKQRDREKYFDFRFLSGYISQIHKFRMEQTQFLAVIYL